MLVTLGHCNTSAMNVSVLHLVFEPALFNSLCLSSQALSWDFWLGLGRQNAGAKRILFQNITTCVANPSVISPAPTGDPYFGGVPNGPASPIIPNPAEGNQPRKDIVYMNIGAYCSGG
jgi:hypothetical protein